MEAGEVERIHNALVKMEVGMAHQRSRLTDEQAKLLVHLQHRIDFIRLIVCDSCRDSRLRHLDHDDPARWWIPSFTPKSVEAPNF